MADDPHHHRQSMEELEQLCNECGKAIHTQSEALSRQALEQVCDKCRKAHEHLPDLMALRRHLHEMTEKYPSEER